MATSRTDASETSRRAVAVDDASAIPWVSHGIAAGVLGASVVALFFLVVDLVAGRPFWTPTALAAALFRGELASTAAAPEPVMVVAYTAMHVTVFVAFAAPAAFWALAHLPSSEGRGRAALLAVALFAGFQVVFVTLAAVSAPGLLGTLRAGRVTAANAMAAIAMAAFIFARARRAPEQA